MKIVNEISLSDFEAWSGGADTLMELTCNLSSEELDTLEAQIVDALDPTGEGISDTQLNDFLWFEQDTIAEFLGFDDWEAFMRGDNNWDEEKDEEEDVDDEETDED